MLQHIKMNRGFFLFLTFFFFGAFVPATSPAGDEDSATILYTGAVKGSLEPINT